MSDGAHVKCIMLPDDAVHMFGQPCGIVPHGTHGWSSTLISALERVREGFAADVLPLPTTSGQGSTYFLCDEHGDPVACFKPLDEEPFTPHNTKGWVGTVGQ